MPAPEPHASKSSEVPRAKNQPHPLTEAQKDQPASDQATKEDTATPAVKTTPAAVADADSNASDSESEWDMRGESPEPESAPCTCNCGGCCSHPTGPSPLHCVRCHADFTFNHSQACSVPHLFYTHDLDVPDVPPHDLAVRSLCCGSEVFAGEPLKGDWTQPFPCFIGWHTTDVTAVDEQYNGLNVLRCNPGQSGKCRRARMKHHAHYRNLFDKKMRYVREDSEDRKNYLKRKREEYGNEFELTFDYVEEAKNIGMKARRT